MKIITIKCPFFLITIIINMDLITNKSIYLNIIIIIIPDIAIVPITIIATFKTIVIAFKMDLFFIYRRY